MFAGGPLFTELGGVFTQLGIVSYGYGCATHLPGVYTRLETYRDWVINVTGEDTYHAAAMHHTINTIIVLLWLAIFLAVR